MRHHFDVMDENAMFEEDDFVSVAEENGNFINSFLECDNLMSFMNRSKVIYARSATIEDADRDVFLQYETDIDGCVVELKSWRGIHLPVRHLTVFQMDNPRLIRSFLKKHVNLTLYSRDQLSSFRHSVGFQLFYENGWEGWIGIIPSARKCKNKLDAEVLSGVGKTYFKQIRVKFQQKLFAERFKVGRTLAKNDMNDVRYFTVLPDDKECIMSILQNAIDETRLPDEFERLQFCFRFGEKCTNGMKLDAFDLSEIIRVTVHSAIDICSDVFDLMWSMTGLQKVVGSRGVLSTCLSFRDCANFQSNLDGKLIDISKDLRDICHNTSGELLFMQLYVDIPHRKPKSRFHPVSGCIAGGLVFNNDTYSAFTRDANSYISTLNSNFSLMNRSSCRLEVVQEVRQVKMILHATDFINVDNVYSLLQNQPLIVPFDIGMVAAVQKLGLSMTSNLKELLEKYSGTGNIEATWKAYQLELAAEKLLWGTPFASVSYLLSVNLGPGRLEESRSLTDDKGFLALEKWTACMATEYSIPPCCVWTTSQTMQSKVRRVVGLHDVLESSAFVIGRRMVHTLLVDLYEGAKMSCRLEEFKREMFSDTPTVYRVSGGVTLSRLAELLSSNRRLGVHMVFGYQVKLIRKTQLDLGEVILDGLNDLRLKHFPALKLYDNHGHQTLCWDKRFGLWKICYNERNATEMQPSPMLLTKLIITELELRRVVYASKLKSVPIRFPWVASCVKKLSREKLSDDQLVCLLSFISCVALIMNGWFVDYERLQTLYTDLPVTQHRLKDLEIQSKLLLSKCNTIPVYRLHQSIPTRLTVQEKKESASMLKDQPQMDVRVEEVVEREITNTFLISDDGEEQKDQRIKPRAATCLPLAKGMCRWIAEEIEVLYMVLGRKRKHDEGYQLYKDECLKKNVPFHGKEAFRRKIQRVAKDIGSQS